MPTMQTLREPDNAAAKAAVADFWDKSPCGSTLVDGIEPGTPAFFEATEAARYRQEPFVRQFAGFDKWQGRRVLEVGCGMGADLSMFARNGAHAFGLDLTFTGASLSARRLMQRGLTARVMVADSECLPFPDGVFDLVYSWGVIHHSPNTPAAARELQRVVRAGGKLIAMIYNRHSLVALQAYLIYGVLRGRPLRPLKEIMASHLESPGTKAFTREEAREMFGELDNLSVTPIVTPYDLRIGRNRFLPAWVGTWLPRSLGYFMVIEGTRPNLS